MTFDDFPRIAGPTPNFPHKFTSTQAHQDVLTPSTHWPDSTRDSSNGDAAAGAVNWKLKDDKELYIQALETKLRSLGGAAATSLTSSTSSSSKPESSYQSHPAFSPRDSHSGPYYDDEEDDNLDYGVTGELVEEEGEEDLDQEGEREGHALLKNVVPPATTPRPDLEEDLEESSTPPDASGSHFNVIPPTPSEHDHATTRGEDREGTTEGDEEEEDQRTTEREGGGGGGITYRMPSELSSAHREQNQRISFSGSVRISGGIKSNRPKKGAKKRKRLAPNSTDLFTPSSPPPAQLVFPPTTTLVTGTPSTSDLDVGPGPPNRVSSTSSISVNSSQQNSRSASPSSSSFEIHTRNLSNTSLSYLYQHQQPGSGYASSVGGGATSGAQSRSSSPCSSIYAPLQPPSKTCPSPLNVRLVRAQQEESPRGRSFREYLRGRGGGGMEGESGEEDDFEGDEEEEEGMKGYRDLVERQRRKRAKMDDDDAVSSPSNGRGSRRGRSTRGSSTSSLGNGNGSNNRDRNKGRDRSKSPGLWSRIKEMLLMGGAVGAMGGGGARGAMAGSIYGATGVTPLAFTSVDGGVGVGGVGGVGNGNGRVRGRGRTRREIRRTTSNLAISVSSSDQDQDEDEASALLRSRSNENESDDRRSDSGQSIKTPMDVMFGPSPRRWIKFDWWIFKIKEGWRAIDCFGLMGRGRGSKEEEGRGGGMV